MAKFIFADFENWLWKPISWGLKTSEICFHQVGEFSIHSKANGINFASCLINSLWKKLFQCAFWRSYSMEYFSWYFIEKVSKRLQNVRENPDSDDVLKKTLDNEVLFEFIAEYEKIMLLDWKPLQTQQLAGSRFPKFWKLYILTFLINL